MTGAKGGDDIQNNAPKADDEATAAGGCIEQAQQLQDEDMRKDSIDDGKVGTEYKKDPGKKKDNSDNSKVDAERDAQHGKTDDNDSSDDGGETDCEEEGPVPQGEKIKEVTNNNIYIRKLVKSELDRLGKPKKSGRVFNILHKCAFCPKKVMNFAQHIFGKQHQDEPEIVEIEKLDVKIPEEKKKRDRKIDILRNKAVHSHNRRVIKRGYGEIQLARRIDEKEWQFNILDYGPCPSCLGWFTLKALWRHQGKCPAKTKHSVFQSKGSLIMQSQILTERLIDVASVEMKKEVFPIMRQDLVGKAAQEDSLILLLGNYWLQQNIGNKLMRRYYTSSAMRLVAKLLLNIRQLLRAKEKVSLWDCLVPSNYDIIVKASLLVCAKDDVDEEMGCPSNALKLGHDLKKLCLIKESESIMKGYDNSKKHAKEVLKLLKLNWNRQMLKEATMTLDERKFNKRQQLPQPGRNKFFILGRANCHAGM